MNWNDYEAVWQRQELPVGADADLANLQSAFETKRRKMAAVLLARDWLEIAACVVVAASLAAYWHKIGRSAWPIGMAIVLVLNVGVVFLRERLRARRKHVGPDASLRTKIEADLAELRHQARMVHLLWLWYLGPCAAAMAIQAWVIVSHTRSWDPLRSPLSLIVIVGFIAATCGFAWAINRRAVRLRIQPRIAELEKLRRSLLEQNGGEAAAAVVVRH